MKIAIIGTGNMGSAFAHQLVAAGHEVSLIGRSTDKVAALAAETGAQAASAKDARDADIVILATGYGDAVAALEGLGNLAGKTVIDITNPLTADYMGLTIGHASSAAEEIAKAVPGVNLVKAFNTVFAQRLAAGPTASEGQTVPVFVASDDAGAKETAATLARSLGFGVVDAGPLKNARYLEPLAGLNIYLGYGAGLGTSIAPAWLS